MMGREIYHVDWEPKRALEGMNQLTALEELAFRRLIDLIYATGNELADDDANLAWLTKTGGLATWRRVKAALLDKGKIFVEEGRIRNKTCDRKIADIEQRIAQTSQAGKASLRRRKALKEKETGSTGVGSAVGAAVGTSVDPAVDAALAEKGVRGPTDGQRIHKPIESRKKEEGEPSRGSPPPSSRPKGNGGAGPVAGDGPAAPSPEKEAEAVRMAGRLRRAREALWRRALVRLRRRLDGAAYAWVAPLRLVAVEGGAAVLHAPSRMIADQAAPAAEAILDALAAAGAEVTAVRFETAAGRAA